MFRDDVLPLSSNLSTSELFLDSTPGPRPNDENNLDDIWGSAPSSSTSETFPSDVCHIRNEPSDIPRLRSEHSTSGYRDGLSAAKNTTIQEGFDEGYSLGAVMGLEIGILLGLLEGICQAVGNIGASYDSEKERTNTLLDSAKRELRTEEIFGRDWWIEDGTWKFEVLGEGVDGAGEFTFKDVVNSHPTILKWKRLVNEEVGRWALDLTILERAEDERRGSDNEG
jgi:hypothetical protein